MDSIDFVIQREILKIGNRLNNTRDTDLKRHHITATQSETLLLLSRREPITATQLKDYLKITHQASRALIERLVEKGYVFLQASHDDGRVHEVWLTDMGKTLVADLKQSGGHEGTVLLQPLTLEEKQALRRLLEKIGEKQ